MVKKKLGTLNVFETNNSGSRRGTSFCFSVCASSGTDIAKYKMRLQIVAWASADAAFMGSKSGLRDGKIYGSSEELIGERSWLAPFLRRRGYFKTERTDCYTHGFSGSLTRALRIGSPSTIVLTVLREYESDGPLI
jgi:hypothetical protein